MTLVKMRAPAQNSDGHRVDAPKEEASLMTGNSGGRKPGKGAEGNLAWIRNLAAQLLKAAPEHDAQAGLEAAFSSDSLSNGFGLRQLRHSFYSAGVSSGFNPEVQLDLWPC
jgi:hypothetical protein